MCMCSYFKVEQLCILRSKLHTYRFFSRLCRNSFMFNWLYFNVQYLTTNHILSILLKQSFEYRFKLSFSAFLDVYMK